MHRFFVPEVVAGVGETVSLLPIHHQLFRVLRAQPGDQLLVLDNAGNERQMEVVSIERRDTLARVLEMRPAPREPETRITLYQCILKADKFDLVVQKATELGVSEIVPVISNRTVARMGRVVLGKQARWESIVREAAEQSGRGALPLIGEARTFAEATAGAGGTRLLPWEEGEANPGLVSALRQSTQPVSAVSILIGPEGGLEAAEVTQAIDAGWQVVSLGQRILRAETAAIASLSVVALALGQLGDGPMVKMQEASKATEAQAAASKAVDSEVVKADAAMQDKQAQAETAPKEEQPASVEKPARSRRTKSEPRKSEPGKPVRTKRGASQSESATATSRPRQDRTRKSGSKS
jgi:16S rRNA (uracil1498-N3)-methyltransferase